jgi:hypothetical protein
MVQLSKLNIICGTLPHHYTPIGIIAIAICFKTPEESGGAAHRHLLLDSYNYNLNNE